MTSRRSDIETWLALEAVRDERERQDAKWGEQNHTPVEWLSVLVEEVGEAAQRANEIHWHDNPDSRREYHDEMVQVAAVAVAALEAFGRGAWAHTV